jgi:hypothetical protein
MRRFGYLAAFMLAATGLAVGTASAAPPEDNRIACFSGSTDDDALFNGTCTLLSPNRALLNTFDNDADPNNAYAGVYVPSSREALAGTLLGDVTKLSFHYRALGNTTATGGSPRISIPISTDTDADYELWAFVDVLGCNDGSTTEGRLDVGNDPTCTISLSNGEMFTSWAAFAAAHPTWQIGDWWAFVVVDQPGEWLVWNVKLGTTSRGAS